MTDARQKRAAQYVEMSKTVEGDPLRWMAWELMITNDKLNTANERNSDLEAALVPLLDPVMHGRPGGYIDGDTYNMPNQDVRWSCTYCGASWVNDAPESHEDDCPVVIARDALQRGE